MLLRRYLSLRDGGGTPVAGDSAAATERADRRSEPPASAEAAAAEQHAVMASVVVLAERLGARVFGTGMQMLSCIRLVLEHEQPRAAVAGGVGVGGGPGSDSGDGHADAAARVARMEAAEEEDAAAAAAGEGGGTGTAESGLGLGLGRAGEGDEDGDSGDTLCSVVLALLTTILELGEDERTAEEEAELQAMLGPLKVRFHTGKSGLPVAEQRFTKNQSFESQRRGDERGSPRSCFASGSALGL